MIFKGTIEQVLNRTKTQTRRPVKSGDFLQGPIKLSKYSYSGEYVIRNNRTRFEVRKTYAVQPGRGKKSIGRIKIKKISREYIQGISDSDLLAEGIEFDYVGSDQLEVRRRSFINLWDSLYAKTEYRWDNNPVVWVLEFELVKL